MMLKNSSQISPESFARPAQERTTTAKPVVSKASIFQEQEQTHCPYIEFAIMYLPEIHEETWQSILTLAQGLDNQSINTMAEQLTQAITRQPFELYNQTLINLQQWNYSDSFLLGVIARARLRGHQS